MSTELLAPPALTAPVHIMELDKNDSDHVIGVFESLSEFDRYYRFFRSMPVYSSAVLDMLTGMNGTDHVAVGAFSGGVCVGVARYIKPAGREGVAELAVVVSAPARGHGLARRMLSALDAPARINGIAEYEVFVHPQNRPGLSLFRSLGFELTFNDGAFEGTMAVPRAKSL